MKLRINPYAAVLGGVLCASFSSLFVRLADAPSLIIALYRMLFTFLLLAPVNLLVARRDILALTKKQILLAAASGAFLALHLLTWFVSLEYTTVASSTVLVTMQPIFVMIGSLFIFKEKVSLKALAGGTLALAGSIYIGATDFQLGSSVLLGDLLALLAAVLVAAYLLLGRYLRNEISNSAYTFVVYLVSSLLLSVLALGSGSELFAYRWTDWLLFAALALVCTVGGHAVFSWALGYVQTAVVSVCILGEPIGATVWAAVFLGELPSGRQLLGILVILLGLFIFIKATVKAPVGTVVSAASNTADNKAASSVTGDAEKSLQTTSGGLADTGARIAAESAVAGAAAAEAEAAVSKTKSETAVFDNLKAGGGKNQ